MEENQNVGMSVETLSPLLERAKSFTEFAKNARATKNQQALDQLSADQQRVFNYSLSTKDHWVAQDCTKDIKISQVADGINRNFYNGTKAIEVQHNARNFVNWWLANNKRNAYELNDYAQAAIDYIKDENNVDCDPTEFYKAVGWVKPGTTETKTLAEAPTKTETPTTENQEWEWVSEEVADWENEYAWRENVLGGLVETALGIPEMITKGGAYLGYFKNSMIKGNEWDQGVVNKANLNKTLNAIDDVYEKLTPGDPESATRMWVNVASDLIATAIALFSGVWAPVAEEKITELAVKTPKLIKAIKAAWSWEKFAKKMPRVAKQVRRFLDGSTIWLEVEAINNALDGEIPEWKELLGWAIAWWITEWLLDGKTANKISTFLRTDWLMTSTRLGNIVKSIKDTVKEATPERVAEFMTKYWLTGSREKIIARSKKLYENAMKMVDWIFAKVEWTHESKATSDAIQSLLKKFRAEIKSWKATKSGYEETINFLKKAYNKANQYSATVQEQVKRLVDKEIHAFTQAWDVASGYSSWVKTRGIIQKELEELGKPFGNIELLNNVVQTSYGIMKWAEQKLAREWLIKRWARSLPIATFIPMARDVIKGNWDRIGYDAILPLIAWNTWLKTHLWSLMDRMSWTTRQQLSALLTSEWKEALSKDASEELMQILKWDNSFKEWLKNFAVGLLKTSVIEWGQELGEWIGDLGWNLDNKVYTEVVK